jgi:CRP-like cAMP-binding protein
VTDGRKEREELLQKVSMFSALNKKELTRLASVAEERRVPSGTVLTKEGESGDEFYVVAEGMAEASIGGRKVGSIPAGSFFGEMSLLDRGPRTATVTAELPTRLVVITAKDFDRVIEDVPAISLKIMRGLASRIRQADEDWG